MASFAAALKARDAVRVTIFHDAWANRLEQVTVDAIVVLPMSMQRVGTKLGGMVRVAFDLPSGMREEKDVPADNLLPAAKRRSNAAPRLGDADGWGDGTARRWSSRRVWSWRSRWRSPRTARPARWCCADPPTGAPRKTDAPFLARHSR